MKQIDRALLKADVAQFLAEGGRVEVLAPSKRKAPRRSPKKITRTRNPQEVEYQVWLADLKEHR